MASKDYYKQREPYFGSSRDVKQALELIPNFTFSNPPNSTGVNPKFLYMAQSKTSPKGKCYLQNEYGYPYDKTSSSLGRLKNSRASYNHDSARYQGVDSISGNFFRFSDRYTFQMQPWDLDTQDTIRYKNRTDNPEYNNSIATNLQHFRSTVGILTHGDPDIARTMKYFMYNRWKVPDSNLLFHKTVTYIFFTRPDCNLLKPTGANFTIIDRLKNNSELTMIYHRYPELFKLLTDGHRCGDDDNFNMLLSNQLTAIDISDETIETVEAGRSWSEYSMPYGGAYTGRTAGTFNATFKETSDLSVVNLLKLWLIYIDNVSRGAFLPSYNLLGDGVKDISKVGPSNKGNMYYSHVYTKTLDYAASAYLFICDETGEEILYWTKYYGIYPTSTGSSAMSWNGDNSASNSQPNLSIPFRYAWKKDMSPISLLEFNQNAGVTGNGEKIVYERSWNRHANTSGRAFVCTPYIAFDLVDPPVLPGRNLGVMAKKRTHIKLRFKESDKNSTSPLRDSKLYGYIKYNAFQGENVYNGGSGALGGLQIRSGKQYDDKGYELN